jgi:alginate O-acetyltransferase complex protein AlgI
MLGFTQPGGTSALLAAQIYTPHHLTIIGVCAFYSFRSTEVYDWVDNLSWPRTMVLVPLFVVAIIAMFTQAFNPFLYFQF